MSIAKGVCDWCGAGRLLETGDELSKIQMGKLWCGRCRAGSKDRYKNASNRWLEGQIQIMEEMLEQHPIRWEAPYDHIRMHLFKLNYLDEIGLMKKELRFRSEE